MVLEDTSPDVEETPALDEEPEDSTEELEETVAISDEVAVEVLEEVEEAPELIWVPSQTPEGAHVIAKYGRASRAELEEQIRSWETATEVQTVVLAKGKVDLPVDHQLDRTGLMRFLVALHDSQEPIKPTYDEILGAETPSEDGEDE